MSHVPDQGGNDAISHPHIRSGVDVRAAGRRRCSDQHRDGDRHSRRRIEGCAPGRGDRRDRPGDRTQIRNGQRRAGDIPAAAAATGHLQGASGALGLREDRGPADRAARRSECLAHSDDENLDGRGEPHRQRRDAARRSQLDTSGRQCRSPADGGDAAAGPELAGAVAARERRDGKQRDEFAWSRTERILQPQSRRTADQAERAELRLGRAALQP